MHSSSERATSLQLLPIVFPIRSSYRPQTIYRLLEKLREVTEISGVDFCLYFTLWHVETHCHCCSPSKVEKMEKEAGDGESGEVGEDEIGMDDASVYTHFGNPRTKAMFPEYGHRDMYDPDQVKEQMQNVFRRLNRITREKYALDHHKYTQEELNELSAFLKFAAMMLNMSASDRTKEMKAVNIYLSLIRKYPFDFRAYFNLGNIFYEREQYAEAVELYFKTIERNAECIEGHNMLGVIFIKLKYAQVAQHFIQHGLLFSPRDKDLVYNLNIAMRQNHDMERAMLYTWTLFSNYTEIDLNTFFPIIYAALHGISDEGGDEGNEANEYDEDGKEGNEGKEKEKEEAEEEEDFLKGIPSQGTSQYGSQEEEDRIFEQVVKEAKRTMYEPDLFQSTRNQNRLRELSNSYNDTKDISKQVANVSQYSRYAWQDNLSPIKPKFAEKERITFICVKWGTKYSAAYVNSLYGNIKRNFEFEGFPENEWKMICLTDDNKDINECIECLQLNDLFTAASGNPDVELSNEDVEKLENPNWKGWWYKAALFSPDLDISGWICYLDLDSVIIGNMNFFAWTVSMEKESEYECKKEKHYLKWEKGVFYTLSPAIFRNENRLEGINSSIMIWYANPLQQNEDRYDREIVQNSPHLHFLFGCLREYYDIWNKCIYKFDHYMEMMLLGSKYELIKVAYINEIFSDKVIDYFRVLNTEGIEYHDQKKDETYMKRGSVKSSKEKEKSSASIEHPTPLSPKELAKLAMDAFEEHIVTALNSETVESQKPNSGDEEEIKKDVRTMTDIKNEFQQVDIVAFPLEPKPWSQRSKHQWIDEYFCNC